MSESFQLLLLVCGLYLYECAEWTPLGAVGFRALLPARWRRVRPWHAGPSWRKGALLGAPWPPLSAPLVCEPLPFAVGPRGIRLRRAREEERFVTWEELGEVLIRDRDLLLGKEPFHLATRRLTLMLGRLLREVSGLKPAARPGRLRRFLEARWDASVCRPRLRGFRLETAPLLVLGNVLWLSAFVGLPLLLWTPLARYWPNLCAAALLAWVGCMVLFPITLRRARWLEREAWPDGTHRFMAMASPLSSMRAVDLIGRELCADLEPLAIAAALLSPARFGELARHALLDLEEEGTAASARGDSPAAEDAAWLIAEERGRLVKLLEQRGLGAGQLLAPPPPEDDRVKAYCPRCRSQYLRGEVCPAPSCHGRPLVPFTRGPSA